MKIINKDGFAVVGIKVEAEWKELHTKMAESWQQFKERLDEVEDRKNDEMMDISLNESEGVYTQLIGVEVPAEAEVPDGMTKIIIPPKKYVWYQHPGELTKIGESFGKMYEWAEQQGIEIGDFKLDIGYRKDNSEKMHDLFIQVL